MRIILITKRFMLFHFSIVGLTAAVLALPFMAFASEPIVVTLKDHRFQPASQTVPGGERFRLKVLNRDNTPAEFESSDAKFEKIVVGGGEIIVPVGPLKPGIYHFFDEYHPDTAQGSLVVSDPEGK